MNDLDRETVLEMATYKYQKDSRMEWFIEKYELGEWSFLEAANACVNLDDGTMDKDILDDMINVMDLWSDKFTTKDKRAVVFDVIKRQGGLEDYNNTQCTHCGWTEVRPSGRCGECGAKDGEL